MRLIACTARLMASVGKCHDPNLDPGAGGLLNLAFLAAEFLQAGANPHPPDEAENDDAENDYSDAYEPFHVSGAYA